jgi:ribosomal-protein-serine acetyltransferase
MAEASRKREPVVETCSTLPLSEGICLRPFNEEDVAELHALIDVNRARLAAWMSWAAGQTLDDTAKFIRRTMRQLVENDGFQTAIVCEEAIAGVIGYIGVDWQNRSTCLGYWLGESYQGKGTMTLAVQALVNHALSVWHLNRVEIRPADENRRSRAIPERLGFSQDGILRSAELVNGRYLDVVVYSMLAADWRAEQTL